MLTLASKLIQGSLCSSTLHTIPLLGAYIFSSTKKLLTVPGIVTHNLHFPLSRFPLYRNREEIVYNAALTVLL